VLANDLRFASRELVADDLDGPRAERYGYINRAVADDRLDDEVEAIATRLSRFDHEAIARVKSYVDLTTLPSTSNGLSGNAWSTPCPTRTPERTVRTAAGSRGIGHHAFRVPRGLAVIIVLTPRAVPALRLPGLSGRGRRGRWRQGEPWCDARGKARVYHGRDRVPPRVTMADVDELWRQP